MTYRLLSPIRRYTVFAAAIVGLSLVAASARAAAIDLLILAGQSNMVGRAQVAANLPGSKSIDQGIRFYYDVTNTAGSFSDDSNQTFGPLQPWRFNASTRNFGPEISLGRELVSKTRRNLAMVKVAIGGSDIARWQPSTGVDYQALVAAVDDGIDELLSAGHSVRLLGMVFLQGESDMISTARADAYASRLQSFVAGFRKEMHNDYATLGFGHLPVFLVEAADWKNGSNPNIATAENIEQVDQAQRDLAANDPYAWFIPTDDFTTFGDGLIHFSAADQSILGSRIANSIRKTIVPEPSSLLLALLVALLNLKKYVRQGLRTFCR